MVSDFLPIQKVRQTFGGQNYKKKGTLQTKIKKTFQHKAKCQPNSKFPAFVYTSIAPSHRRMVRSVVVASASSWVTMMKV